MHANALNTLLFYAIRGHSACAWTVNLWAVVIAVEWVEHSLRGVDRPEGGERALVIAPRGPGDGAVECPGGGARLGAVEGGVSLESILDDPPSR